MSKHILVIDDVRVMHFHPDVFGDNAVDYARTPKKGIIKLNEYPWDQVWLDHDMGEETIKPVVDFLINNPKLDIGRIYCHSANPVARRGMLRDLARFTSYEVDEVNLLSPYVKDQILVETIYHESGF